MEGDEVLKGSGGGPPGGGGGPAFGRDEYFLAFLGAPSLTEPWMIQFGGHHLAINLTIVGKSNVLTPSLPPRSPPLSSSTVKLCAHSAAKMTRGSP
jgi:hypothetical protein